jgi:hypothetical protein
MLFSCDNESTNTPDDKTKNKPIEVNGFTIMVHDSITVDDIRGYIVISEDKMIDEYGSYQRDQFLAAFFVPDVEYIVNAGEITFNSGGIQRYVNQIPNSSDSTYSYLDDIDLDLDGSTNYITISGSNYIPQVSFQINSLLSSISSTNPLNNSTVSRNSNLNVSWSGQHDSTNQYIRVAILATGHGYVGYFNDTGSLTIPVSELSQFSNGPANFEILCFKYLLVPIGNYYIIVFLLSSDNFSITFTN